MYDVYFQSLQLISKFFICARFFVFKKLVLQNKRKILANIESCACQYFIKLGACVCVCMRERNVTS